MNYAPIASLRDWERLIRQIKTAKAYYNFTFVRRRFRQDRPAPPPVEYISFLSKQNETLAKIETHYVDLEGDSLFFDIGGKLFLVYYSPPCQCIVLKHLTKDGKTIKEYSGVTAKYDVSRGTTESSRNRAQQTKPKKAGGVTWAEFFRGWMGFNA